MSWIGTGETPGKECLSEGNVRQLSQTCSPARAQRPRGTGGSNVNEGQDRPKGAVRDYQRECPLRKIEQSARSFHPNGTK